MGKKVLIDVDVLQKLEWIEDEFTGLTLGGCHICGGFKRGKIGEHNILRPGEFVGHTPDCPLGNALRGGN